MYRFTGTVSTAKLKNEIFLPFVLFVIYLCILSVKNRINDEHISGVPGTLL
jgi:hypothetical protein